MQTVGQILVDNALPHDLRGTRVLDKKGIADLLHQVATLHPEKYRDVSHALSDLGWRAAQESGGYSFGLKHLAKAKASAAVRDQLQQRLAAVLDDDRLDDAAREKEVVRLAGEAQGPQQAAVFNESLAEGNPLAYQVLSGSRGNKMNLASLRGSDLLYTDHRGETIPVPILRSYSEGLTPAEYWSGSYGARKGVLDVKLAVADAGFLAKVLNQVTHRLVVEDLDAPQDDSPDAPALRGMPVDTADADNEGSLLAARTGPYARDTVLTPKVLGHLRGLGHARILVRSPIVGGSRFGGVYARDVGVREHGTLPGRGEMPGLAAVQSLAEPLTQGALGSKHSGGVAGGAKAVSGFDYINSLVNIPKHVAGGAAHAELDGTVGRIEEAPAGGHFVWVDDHRHYLPGGAELKVGVGDSVEAGDVLSGGLPSPAKVVEHKGIGEGRRYFVSTFRNAMRDAGLHGHRRNVELLARGLINHVKLTDEVGDHVPDDVVPYSTMEHLYEPRDDAEDLEPSLAAGRYLEKPALHYTVGTRLRPSVVKDLNEFGVKKVKTHRDPPPFEPVMVRGMDNLKHDPDVLTRMYGSGLKGSLLSAVHRGGKSDEMGTSFVPSLARAVDFGRQGLTAQPSPGWKPQSPAVAAPPELPKLPEPVKLGVAIVQGARKLAAVVRAPEVNVVRLTLNMAKLAASVPAIRVTPADLAGALVRNVRKLAAAANGVPGADPSAVPGSGKTLQLGSGQAPGVTTPAPGVPSASPATAPPKFAPYFGSGGSGGFAQQLATAAMPMTSKLPGPLGTLGVLAGVNMDALGSLTRGPNSNNGGEAPVQQPPQAAAPTVAAPAPATGVSPPQQQQPAGQAQPQPQSSPWWASAPSAALNTYNGVAGLGGLAQIGNAGLGMLTRAPRWAQWAGLRAVPGEAFAARWAPRLARFNNAIMPQAFKAAPGARLGGFRAGAGNALALQTAIDTAGGVANAFREGGGNPIKGYDITSEQMSQAAPLGSDGRGTLGGDLRAGWQNETMDPVTTATAMGKYVKRMDQTDPGFRRDALNTAISLTPAGLLPGRDMAGANRASVFNPQHAADQAAGAAAQLNDQLRRNNPAAQSFQYQVDPSGRTKLVDRVSGRPVSTPQELQQLDPATMRDVLGRLAKEVPGQYENLGGGGARPL